MSETNTPFIAKYIKSSEKLTKTGGVPAKSIFNYEKESYAKIFDNLFHFAQVNLDDYSTEWDISPATFYFADDEEVNAMADRRNRRYIISIHRGTIIKLYEQLYNQNQAFRKNDYLKNNYNDFLPANVPPDYIFYQTPALFTYFHEQAHLIQRSPNQCFTEAIKGEPGPYNESPHLQEFDADEHATQMMFQHLIFFWKNSVDQELRTKESVKKILALAIAGMMTYLLWLYDENQPLYFKEDTHPHPLTEHYISSICWAHLLNNISIRSLSSIPAIFCKRVLKWQN